MKFFICFAILIAAAVASPAGVKVQEANEADAQVVQPVVADAVRLRKSAYGGAAGGSSVGYSGSASGSSGGYGGSASGSAGGSSGGYGGSAGVSSGGYGGSAGGSSSGHGGSVSFPAPPCAKNYIFSCQPSLAPVACSSSSSGSSSYGSHGAYSAPIPTFVAPLPNSGYGIPQAFVYNNQYYQY